jgi:hypothetical protein
MANETCQMQRRVMVLINGVHIDARRREQGLHDGFTAILAANISAVMPSLFAAFTWTPVWARRAGTTAATSFAAARVSVRGIHVDSALSEQGWHDACLAVDSRKHQRCPAIRIRGIDLDTRLRKQRLRDTQVSVQSRNHEGGPAVIGNGIRPGAGL